MKKYKLLLLGLLVVIICGAILSRLYIKLNNDKICQGIYVNNISLGGLNKKEATALLEQEVNRLLATNKIKLKYNDKVYEYTYKQLGYTCDYIEVVDEVYKLGREGNYLDRLLSMRTLKKTNHKHTLKLIDNIEVIKTHIVNVSKNIDRNPVNASIRYSNRKFVINPEINGIKVDKEKLEQLIKSSVTKNKNIEIPVIVIKPKKTKELLSHINYKISGFSTSYSTKKINRTYNIKRASISINGRLLMPGEIISFNNTVGSRNSRNGYRQAKILKNGEYVLGMGGGVCQVSTTLYNAALLADLEIIQRKNHSLPSSYVAKGRDATVVFNVYDLKFRNNKKYPIYVMMYNSGNRVYASIYGDKNDKYYDIKITSKVLSKTQKPDYKTKIDNNLKSGERIVDQTSRPGYKVVSYKNYYKNGKFIKSVKLHTDVYKPMIGIIRKGPDN
ncbi:VanW family protein [Clostridiaceae bacterium M8S5]|nr:VanW family protein [Clostridiaceae bacterium M8S5]